jgi:chromosome segregation protein
VNIVLVFVTSVNTIDFLLTYFSAGMRLKHIKLAGFKSFVDPITAKVPADLVGIVGPNGCGKSNIIDAIRWVMGESSAKTLRGDSMDDVIFNGSSTRKPVGKASVALLFDNNDGKVPGIWGQYKELEIRRELVRDGGSTYFINKTRCRRRDIQDIFLGTGLGPRSYSIIEQGMVGRIVESKPEDLRALIEEAAGISKYRERRRETGNRISHTRANLERVEDIMSELATQLRRLKRQANDAERYKEFKAEQRQLKARIIGLRVLELSEGGARKDGELARLQTEMDAQVAEQRNVETRIEALRKESDGAGEVLNATQAKFYELGAEISSIEQTIQHAREKKVSDQQEQTRLSESLQRLRSLQKEDTTQLQQTGNRLSELAPHRTLVTEEYQGAESMLSKVESSYQDLQLQWDLFGSEAQQPERVRDVEAENIKRTGQGLARLVDKQHTLTLEKEVYGKVIADTGLDKLRSETQTADELFESLQAGLANTNERLNNLRVEHESELQRHNNGARDLESLRARLLSLQEIQSSALKDDDQTISRALEGLSVKRTGSVAEKLSVRSGWEMALDSLLGDRLTAVTVDRLGISADQVSADLDICLIDGSANLAAKESSQPSGKPRLLDYIDSGREYLVDWLSGVYAAQTLGEALQWREDLGLGECIVSKDGALIGRNWLLIRKGGSAEQSVLVRSAEITSLQSDVNKHSAIFEGEAIAIEGLKEKISADEEERKNIEQDFQSASQTRTDLHNRFAEAQAKSGNAQEQLERVSAELLGIIEQKTNSEAQLTESQRKLSEAESRTTELESRREDLITRKEQAFAELSDTRGQLNSMRDRKQSVELEYQGLEAKQNALQQNLQRLNDQVIEIEARSNVLNSSVDVALPDDGAQKARLDSLMKDRLLTEKQLAECRDQVTGYENQIRDCDKERIRFAQNSEGVREKLDDARMAKQELSVRLNTLVESAEYDAEISAGLNELAQLPVQSDVEQTLDKLSARIERIGPVNLVAIDEYKEGTERKEYLDSQCADLTESLQTLESVIAKIDRETRALFKETFDDLNERFQIMFPRLFGGGKASLEMTGVDLLTTGVTVMARPPGKRNSTIHLLSGGEKALTAVALLFGFFELNPAPFCVLDEVDAPLDDANVDRYVNVLRSLSSKTQILFISHNKITMEAANVLVGVTMNEPGVSRMVSVDVERAVEMAAV